MRHLIPFSATVLAVLPLAGCDLGILVVGLAGSGIEHALKDTSSAADGAPAPADEGKAEQVAGPAVQPTGPVPVHVVEHPHAEGLLVCEVVGEVADETGYAAARKQLLACWNKQYDSAKEKCSRNYGAPGPPCYAAIEAEENRETALSAFDGRWKEASAQ